MKKFTLFNTLALRLIILISCQFALLQAHSTQICFAEFSSSVGCVNSAVSFTNTSGLPGSAYTFLWTFGDGGSSSQTNPTHTYSSAGNYLVKLVIDNGTCNSEITHLVIVNVLPTVDPVSDQTFCDNSATTLISFIGQIPGIIFNWTNSNTSIGLAASGTGDITSFTAVNNTTVPVNATLTVTPVVNECTGSSQTFTIIVNPSTQVNQPVNQTVCNGAAATAISFSGGIAGTIYNWTNNAPSIGLAANGTGDISSFNVINNGVSPVVATLTVTPSFGVCPGNTKTFTITVTPPVTQVNLPSNVEACNGSATSAVNFSGGVAGTVYNWSALFIGPVDQSNYTTSAGTGLSPDFWQSFTAGYTGIITKASMRFYNCTGSGTMRIYAGEGTGGSVLYSRPFSVSTVGDNWFDFLTDYVPVTAGTKYTLSFQCSSGQLWAGIGNNPYPGGICYWTNFGVQSAYDFAFAICVSQEFGLAHSGTGNILSFTAINMVTFPLMAMVTVIPALNGCFGIPQTFTFTVNPNAQVDQPANQDICNGVASIPIGFTSVVPGTTYGWTNNTPSIGLAASGTGNIASFAAVNTGTTPVIATITVTPAKTGCSASSPKTFIITVYPTTQVTQPVSQTVCNGSPTTAYSFAGSITGTTFTWSNNTPSIGLASGGSGNIASFNGVNTGVTPIMATITVTPSVFGCNGPSKSFTIIVNPPPTNVTPPANQEICNGSASSAVNFSGGLAGTVYNWSAVFSGVVDQSNYTTSAGTGLSPDFWQSFTAGYNGAITQASMRFYNCTGSGTMRIYAGEGTGGSVLYSRPFSVSTVGDNWFDFLTDNVPVTAGTKYTLSFQCSSGQLWAGIGNNPYPGGICYWTNFGVQSAYDFAFAIKISQEVGIAHSGTGDIPSFTASNTLTFPLVVSVTVTPALNGCFGTPQTFTIIVNPNAQVDQPANQTVCNGSPSPAISFTSVVPGTTFSWANSTPSIGLGASGTGNIPTFTAINNGTTPVTATFTVTPAKTGCSASSPKTFTIIVYPTTQVTQPSNQTVCNGSATTAYTFTGSLTGTTFSWTNNTPSIGLAASGNGNIASFNGANTGNSPLTATITVTPSLNGCNGPPKSFTITVNAPPTIVNPPSNQEVCNGTASAAVNFSGGVAGTVYNWSTLFSGPVDQSNYTTSAGTGLSPDFWQSFTAGYTGIITKASMRFYNCTGSGTMRIYAGEGTGGSVLYSRPFSVSTVGDNWFDFLTDNVPVTAGTKYTLSFQCSSGQLWAGIGNNPYPGGICYWTSFGVQSGYDFAFAICVSQEIGIAHSGTGNIPSFIATNSLTFPIVVTVTVTPGLNGCFGTPQVFTITVNNQIPTFNNIASQTLCNGAATTLVSFSGGPAGTVYNWGNNTPSIGLASSGSGNIASFTAVNNGASSVTAAVTVTPVLGGCTGSSKNFTISVYPKTTVTSQSNVAYSNGANTTAITFSGQVTGTTFNWINSNTSIGLVASGSGDIASFVATNPTTSTVVSTITVTPTANGCPGTPITFTITVYPTATVNSVSNVTYCNGISTAAINFTGPVSGTTFTWINSNPSIGLAASGSGDILSFVATNSGNVTISSTITVTPTANGFAGTPISFTITVYPTATVSTTGNVTYCNGNNTAAITFAIPVSGTIFNWTNSNTSIGLGASGSTNIASFVATNPTTSIVVSSITVTPIANGCTGTPLTFTITVYPTTTVNSVSNVTYCNGLSTAGINFAGPVTGTTFAWNNSDPSIGLGASGSGSFISSFVATNNTNTTKVATITVTPTANGCPGNPRSFTITVYPTATIGSQSNVTYCNGNNTVDFTFAGPVTGTNYPWINSNASIGLAASGSGSIASFIATNPTNVIAVATITVTPTANGCPGTQLTFTITVYPTATINSISNVTYCNGLSTAAISFAGPVTGTTFAWNNSDPSIGLGASGSGNIPSFVATNNTNTTKVATITVNPTANGCPGTSRSFTITIYPTATVSSQSNVTYCNGNSTANFTFPGPVTGTAFTWINSDPSIGLAASGNGNISSFVATNITNATVVSSITVTPTANNCTGTPLTFTITVYPTTTVNSVSNVTICNSFSTPAIFFSGPVTGTTFTWTNSDPSIGLPANGSGNIASFVATNPGNSTVFANILVTPSANGCPGTPLGFSITVLATPGISCTSNINVYNTPGQCGANVTYAAATVTGSPPPSVIYSTASGSFFPLGTTTVTATASNLCGSVSCSFTVTVTDNQPPVIVCPSNILHCYDPAGGGSVEIYTVTATDNACPPTVISVPPSGTLFPFGTTTVVATATDGAGNTASCSFLVVVTGISGTVTVGSGGRFSTLTGFGGLFNAINTYGLCGNLTALITSNITEPGIYGLNDITYYYGGPYNVTIQPGSAVIKVITGNVSNAMIRLNGADRVTFEGKYSGSGLYLRFRNNNTSFPTLSLGNGSRYNNFFDVFFDCMNTSVNSGGVVIGGSTAGYGNTNNMFNNDIFSNTSGSGVLPANLVYASGTIGKENTDNAFWWNQFKNFNQNGIYITATGNGPSWDFAHNSFYQDYPTPATLSQCAINFIPGPAATGATITFNNIGGNMPDNSGTWSNSGAATIKGISVSAASVLIEGNTITNFLQTNIGQTNFVGIELLSGDANLKQNTIGSSSSANAISMAGLANFFGIRSMSPNSNVQIHDNIVANITSTVSSGYPNMYGICVRTGSVYNNQVLKLGTSASGSYPAIFGIENFGLPGLTTVYYNNRIALDGGTATNPKIFGIQDNAFYFAAPIPVARYFHNSVEISGAATTSSKSYAFQRNFNGQVEIKNNIFSNKRASSPVAHFAISSGNTTGWTANYNDLYVTSSLLGYWNASSRATLAIWKTATAQDVNSISVAPVFTGDLHLNPLSNPLLNNVCPNVGIGNDIDGDVRGPLCDFGADEFNAGPRLEPETSTSDFAINAYPNPFSTMIQLYVRLSRDSKIILSIYNTLGEKIADVADEDLYAGNYTYTFNGSSLTAGVYLCRMTVQTGNRTDMVLKRIVIER